MQNFPFKKVHFIGICGAGMSAVAKLLKDGGVEVSGSDEGFYPPISDYINDNGIKCTPFYSEENITGGEDVIVIGKHAKLTPEENIEVKKSFDLYKDKIKSFPEVLEILTQNRRNILCVGSFGKSTTTAITAHVLDNAGKDPGYFIGALPFSPKTNASVGTSEYFILEGDEYPTSNWDNKSKFLYLHPQAVLLTSLEHDHVNIYKTHEDYKKPFFELFSIIEDGGLLVYCAEDKSIKDELPNILKSVPSFVSYGLEEGTYTAKDLNFGEVTTFTLCKNDKEVVEISTTLLGKHNIQNIVGVSALLLEKEMVTKEELQKGVSTFLGVKRRLDLLTEPGKSLKIYEGFGSSYAKARAAIEAVTLHYPEKSLVIIFEPHTFSWRNREAIYWYDTVFKEAKTIFVYEPPTHGSNTHTQLTKADIIERINSIKSESQNVFSLESGVGDVPFILENITNNDVVLILSSGDLGGIIKELPKKAF